MTATNNDSKRVEMPYERSPKEVSGITMKENSLTDAKQNGKQNVTKALTVRINRISDGNGTKQGSNTHTHTQNISY